MRIHELSIANFQRIARINIKTQAPILLVAGRNEAGKSSIKDAIKLAVTGVASRVALQKDYKCMIRDGAKESAIEVSFGEAGNAVVSTQKFSRSGTISEKTQAVLPGLLEPHTYAAMPSKERRNVLFDVAGASFTGKEVCATMVERGADLDRVNKILPMLRSGFPAAMTAAKDEAKEARGAWKAITGEVYGVLKADEWRRDIPEYDNSKLVAAEAEMSTIQNDIATTSNQLAIAAALKVSTDKIPELESIAASEDEIASTLSGLIEQKRALEATRPASPSGAMSCPHCGGLSTLSNGTLIPDDDKPKASKKEMEKYQRDHCALTADIERCDDALRQIRNARSELDAIKRTVASAPNEREVELFTGLMAGLQHRKEALTADIAETKKMASEAAAAEKANARARAYHEDIKAWEGISAMLAPDGIPAEILSRAIGPINSILVDTAAITGWPATSIDGNMDIWVGGRPYGLASESAQWRADAAIACAIASVSGVKFFAIDRVDVLDIDNRARFMRWIHGLVKSGTIDGALLLGTFKEAPKLPETFDVIWLEEGAMTTESEEVEAAA